MYIKINDSNDYIRKILRKTFNNFDISNIEDISSIVV